MSNDNFILGAFFYVITAVVCFSFGHMFGREHQCTTMGAEFKSGKCVLVTRTEVKP